MGVDTINLNLGDLDKRKEEIREEYQKVKSEKEILLLKSLTEFLNYKAEMVELKNKTNFSFERQKNLERELLFMILFVCLLAISTVNILKWVIVGVGVVMLTASCVLLFLNRQQMKKTKEEQQYIEKVIEDANAVIDEFQEELSNTVNYSLQKDE
ncbi:hypothetical protein PRVXT_001067 [Proteinivorax tanatarense]|uniref:Uncharacterized protein n=1 Tax=Proteinivorax tanatarense TaxID=1260629 RepID=A0AAU7VPC7_9FIRM